VEGVRRFLGADSLRYLDLAGLKRATEGHPFCFGCMTGEYPT
jgi:glutamine phosphoribosylpyrophosphate amidotransferase